MKRRGGGLRVLGIAAAIIFSGFFAANVAFAVPVTWIFDLPSTAVASQNPPYPSVATLTLTEITNGVLFTLTPNWGGTGTGFSSQSFIERIDYVYMGPALSGSAFSPVSGALVKNFDYLTNQHNMDSSYTTNDQHIRVDFLDKNDPSRFDNTYLNSQWSIVGTSVDLSDFTGTFATSNSHPSPTQGVISVTAYSLDDPKPTPSNWVTGPGGGNGNGNGTQVPEPTTMFLLGSGLIGLAAFRRKFRK